MGACCSKTNNTITSTPTLPEIKIKHKPQQPEKKNNNTSIAIVASATEQQALKKDVFEVNPRKSNEIDRHPNQEIRKSIDRKKIPNSSPKTEISQSVTTNSAGAGGVTTVRASSCTEEEVDAILIQCGRLSRSSSGVKPAGGETPTRGRRYSGSKRGFDFDLEMGSKNDDDDVVVVVGGDEHQHHRRQQREVRVSSPSSRRRSRERDPLQQRSGSKERGSGNGGRRVSRSPNRRSESPNCNATIAAGGGGNRPGKMVSVPATDKSNNGGGVEVVAGGSGGVKRVQAKRNNAGEAVVAAGSRKAEQSPRRRNPLCEIDTNVVGSEQPGSKKPNGEKMMNSKSYNVKNSVAKDTQMLDEMKTLAEDPKHNQIVSRTRSSRPSQDLDINPETLVNPNLPSYASLLLEDIQNFHHKNPTLPGSVSKGCSVFEAAGDLKSATSFSDRQSKKHDLVESEKAVYNELMEPSLHKYVTVRRGGDADTEEQESSGSNSFAGSQQLSWMLSSWEPNSGDSTDCWTSKSRSDAGDTEVEKSSEYPRNGIGRGRAGVHHRSAYSLPNNAAVALT